jgi:hypothetical protein
VTPVSIDELLELGATDRASLPADLAAILKNNERRNAADLKPRGDLRIVVGIEFGDQETAGVLVRELVDCRRHRLAWRTPVGIEIYQHGNLRIRDHAIELTVVQFDRAIQQEETTALAALRPLRQA